MPHDEGVCAVNAGSQQQYGQFKTAANLAESEDSG
jgi:hypothetical protein